jgi:CheY-like chemotaxis protein
MSASIRVVDDEPDVAELFRQQFRRDTRQGVYVLHYVTSEAEALDQLRVKSSPGRSWSSLAFAMPDIGGL